MFTLGESKEGFQVMDKPGDAKYGMTRPQLAQAFARLRELGTKRFGIHAFLASNTISNEYYPALARLLFETAAQVAQETGCHIAFINLSGGVGVPYRPDQSANDIAVIGEGVRRAYEDILVPAGMGDEDDTQISGLFLYKHTCTYTHTHTHTHTHTQSKWHQIAFRHV